MKPLNRFRQDKTGLNWNLNQFVLLGLNSTKFEKFQRKSYKNIIFQLLLSKGANVNDTNNEGKNAVDLAQQGVEEAPDEETKSKYEEMVQLLQQHM